MLVCNWYYLKILTGAIAISSKHTTNKQPSSMDDY